MDEHDVIPAIVNHAKAFKLPPEIVYGIGMLESRLNPLAARYEPHYRWLYKPMAVRPENCSLTTEEILQKTSWGVMQVMGAVFREYGLRGWLTVVATDVNLQLRIGCQHLSRLVKRYGLDEGILAYNAGSPRKNEAGEYVNAYYLRNVMSFAQNLK